MTISHRTSRMSRRGVAMLVTLLFLAVFAVLAVAIAASADMNLIMSRNRLNSQQAGALAETGLQLARRHIGGISVPSGTDASSLHKAIADHLEATLASSSMLNTGLIHCDSNQVSLPAITITCPDGRTGEVCINILASGGAADNTTVTLTSTGRFDNAAQTVHYNMTVQRGRSVLADYGIASKSPVRIEGDAWVLGVNDASEASVMSATYSTPRAITFRGECGISGDAAVCNPNGEIRKAGNVTIGGNEITGATEPEWPQVNTDLFEPYATNTYTGDGSGNLILSNVRIPPNTNPNFSGNTVIYGVMYVESPNRITFSGNTNFIGLIVCETPEVDNLAAHSIQFTGSAITSGTENLPADPQYDGLRELTGSFLLAPGYSAKFAGNFGAINGCMVASEFQFTGDASGRVKGGIINLRDSQFTIKGESMILIDKSDTPEHPAGLETSLRLVCVSGSYRE